MKTIHPAWKKETPSDMRRFAKRAVKREAFKQLVTKLGRIPTAYEINNKAQRIALLS